MQDGHLHVQNNTLNQLFRTWEETGVQLKVIYCITCDKTKTYAGAQDLGKGVKSGEN